MKKTEIKDLKLKNLNDLKNKTNQLRIDLTEIMIEKSLGKLKDAHKARAKRKEIAQVLTFVAQKKLESQLLNSEKSQEEREKQK